MISNSREAKYSPPGPDEAEDVEEVSGVADVEEILNVASGGGGRD